MTRQTIVVEISPNGWPLFRGLITDIKCDVCIYASVDFPGSVGLLTINRIDQDGAYAYIANRNALDLLKSAAPITIVLDALIESEDNEWHVNKRLPSDIPLARRYIEALATMELLPMEANA